MPCFWWLGATGMLQFRKYLQISSNWFKLRQKNKHAIYLLRSFYAYLNTLVFFSILLTSYKFVTYFGCL